jgi:prophage regulatory protein
MDERLLRLKQVIEIIPVSKSTWWAWVAAGKAPAAIKLGDKTTCWRLSEVMALIEQKEG